MPLRMGFAAVIVLLVACGGGKETPGLDTKFVSADDPAYAARQDGAVDPRISRSAGVKDGLVVLWPRVVPATGERDAVAQAVQAQLVTIASRLAPAGGVDTRPSPERTCPRAGCVAQSVSAVVLHKGEGCAVVLSVSAPGESEARLSSLLGEVTITPPVIPFRETPENHLRPTDFIRCSDVASLLPANADAIEATLRGLRRGQEMGF